MVTDHLGNSFNSEREMCKYWGVGVATYRYRINHNWSKELSLTGTPRQSDNNSKKCYDHLGNCFKSISDMCSYWGIEQSTFTHRINRDKYTLKEALEGRRKTDEYVYDHLGNKYNSVSEMCKFYKIDRKTFHRRLDKMGMSLKDALTTKCENRQVPVTDHKGKVFNNEAEMCRSYGIAVSTYHKRLKSRWPLQNALEIPSTKRGCIDHKGTYYKSIVDMCKAYGIDASIYYNRIKNGWSLQKTLETPLIKNGKEYIINIFGSTYNYISDIPSEYALVNRGMLYNRLNYKNTEKFDTEILIVLQRLNGIRLQFISIDNKAWYKVPWSNKLQSTRDIIEHCRPDLLSLYDSSNPKGEWNPLVKEK